MFSALRLGSTIYILEKGEHPNLKVGQVVSLTQPTYNSNNFVSTTIDINVKAGDCNMDFKQVPSTSSIVHYDNAIITETKELMSTEVDNMLLNSRSIVNSVNYHTNIINSCEEILKRLDPRFAKEKERDEDISNLKNKMGGLESKMDQILTILSLDVK